MILVRWAFRPQCAAPAWAEAPREHASYVQISRRFFLEEVLGLGLHALGWPEDLPKLPKATVASGGSPKRRKSGATGSEETVRPRARLHTGQTVDCSRPILLHRAGSDDLSRRILPYRPRMEPTRGQSLAPIKDRSASPDRRRSCKCGLTCSVASACI